MSPTKQEEYDASHDAFDPKLIYVSVTEMTRYRLEYGEHVDKLQKLAYGAARALEAEREKTRRLEAKVQHLEARVTRFESEALKHSENCGCRECMVPS